MQDPIAGPINWYVVGERSPGLNPQLDFDGIRVFTWNMKRHRYETAYRGAAFAASIRSEIGQRSWESHISCLRTGGGRLHKNASGFRDEWRDRPGTQADFLIQAFAALACTAAFRYSFSLY